jgi:hypothetical protein
MELWNEIAAWLTQHKDTLFRLTRVISVLAVILGSLTAIFVALLFPIRIRLGAVRVDPLVKLIVMGLIVGWMVLSCGVIISSTFVVIAKYIILNVMIATSVIAWVLLFSWPQINRALTLIQQECELATNLTFLQGEMMRSQLEAVSARIHQAIEPEEREVTETMLKTLTPLVGLFLNKERSLVKWSIAGVGVAKNLMGYFFSEKK